MTVGSTFAERTASPKAAVRMRRRRIAPLVKDDPSGPLYRLSSAAIAR
jgi:hypothetical protein